VLGEKLATGSLSHHKKETKAYKRMTGNEWFLKFN